MTKMDYLSFTPSHLQLHMEDGSVYRVTLTILPKLHTAAPHQREVWEFSAAGAGIHWPLIDEDLSISALLRDADLLPAGNVTNSAGAHTPAGRPS